MFVALLLGLAFIAGLTIASFGALKDTLWEGFSIRKFFRTPVITFLVAVLLLIFPGKDAFDDFESWYSVTAYLMVAVMSERFLVDYIYKGIKREMPSKFRRPQRDTRWAIDRIKQVLKWWRIQRHRDA